MFKFDAENPQHQAAQAGEIFQKYGKNILETVDAIVNYVNAVAQVQVLAAGDRNIKATLLQMLIDMETSK